MAAQLTCPHCREGLTFEGPVPLGLKVRCTACGRPFVNAGRTAAGEAAAGDVPVAVPYTPPPPPAVPVVRALAGQRSRPRVALRILGAGAVLLGGAAVLFLLNPFASDRDAPAPKGDEIAQLPAQKGAPPAPESIAPVPPPSAVEKKAPAVAPKKGPAEDIKKPDKKPEEKPKPATEFQRQVEKAVERGVAYLRSPKARADSWTAKSHPVGHASLVGLTLLECGVPREDRVIQAAAEEVRSRAGSVAPTYDLALAVLFLDKLADPGDEKRIRTLAMRLVAGQNGAGGWDYSCPKDNDSATEELFTFLRADQAYQVAKKEKGASKAGVPPTVPGQFRNLGILQGAEPKPFAKTPHGWGDNSNTQFALLALWVARRHGVPLGRTFALAERRFRETQNKDGGWPYRGPAGFPSTRSMTCVGLLGLATGRGSEYELYHLGKAGQGDSVQKVSNQDEGIVRGLKKLGTHINTPTGRTTGLPMDNTYFLWSVQRVAVLYGLPTIGDKDWYLWGAEILLANQQADGRWTEQGNALTEPSVDTCFALLFLKRTNLVPDLSHHLRLYVPIVDPDRKGGTK